MPYTPASWDYSEGEWEQLLLAAEEMLIQFVPATFGHLPAYSDVGDEIARRTGLREFDLGTDHGRNGIGWLLGILNDRLWEQAEPFGREFGMAGCLVSSVVVHKNDRDNPIGRAFYTYARERGLDPGRGRAAQEDFLLRQQSAAAKFWARRRRLARRRV